MALHSESTGYAFYRNSPRPGLIHQQLEDSAFYVAGYKICPKGHCARLGYKRSVTPQEQTRMEQLCGEIAVEKNPERFLRLVRQLNDLLKKSQQHLPEDSNASLTP